MPSVDIQPWALELYDGRRCTFVTGATNAIADQRANYGCVDSNDFLWGYPDRSVQPWMIFSAPPDATALSRKAAIRVAWM
jgi:hypothetical protein